MKQKYLNNAVNLAAQIPLCVLGNINSNIFKKALFSFVAITSLNMASTPVQAQEAQYATALFDKTGSMQVTRADGKTRCQYGKELFLTTIRGAMGGKADHLNVKVFGARGELFSLTNGFMNISGLSPDTGRGKVFFDSMASQVNALSCDSSNTALGDAICESSREIRSHVTPSTRKNPRLAVVTDAGENYSQYCGGADYVNAFINPILAAPAPWIRMDVSILVPPGNVSLRMSQSAAPSFENVPTPNASARIAITPGFSSEVNALVRAAELSGGGAIVIQDNATCNANCDPLSQGPNDDWGGAW